MKVSALVSCLKIRCVLGGVVLRYTPCPSVFSTLRYFFIFEYSLWVNSFLKVQATFNENLENKNLINTFSVYKVMI